MARPADTLFINADFLTMDPARPQGQALPVRRGRIQELGSPRRLSAR
ncbi:hypothetical protein [Streptomyces sp. GESEQ-35]|nr:hypothetical protein [Streptomyces sp. GESEQ-35]